MFVQDITGKTSGRIWSQKSTISQEDGIRAMIAISGTGLKAGKCHRFLHSSFVRGEERIIAGDHLGLIYHLDIPNNRFSVIQNTGQACTCIATGLKSLSEYLVAVADTSIKCYAIESKEMISWMRGHSKTVHTMSVHDSGTLAISSSNDTAQLWDLENFERKRKLTVASATPIQKVFFLPLTNVIITCFKDNTVFGWDVYTLDWKFQLKSNSHSNDFDYKAFAVTSDGKLLVTAGKSNRLHIYSLDSLEIVRIIQLSDQISSVKALEFLPDRFAYNGNKILGVLSSEGTMTFIDIKTCNPVFKLTLPVSGDKLMNVAVSSSGNHITATTVGGLLVIYDTLTLCSDLNKAPDPLVKVVGNVWKRKSTEKKSKTSFNHSRPNNRSISSGRIRCKKFHSERDEPVSTDDILPNGLSKQRLINVLREYGEYPEQYRMFIWRSLLQLPENHVAFSALVAKSTHPVFTNLDDLYPLKSRRLEHILQKILSALAHWSTIFGELDYLPFIVFPFVKLFQNNHLTCFEIVASLVVNWCQHWFEFFPNPPISILAIVENVLTHHDKKLIRHFVKFNITSQIYAWPLLQSIFTEVFTRTEWLKFFDHVFSNDPSFMLYAVAAYCITFHSALLQTYSSDDIKYFFHHQNALDFEAFIKETYHLAESTPGDICIRTILDPFRPLPAGPTYTVFNKYPRFVVNYQAQEREKIRKNELEYLEERKMIEEMTKEIPDMNLEAEMLYQNQELLTEAATKRRKLLKEEEEKYVERKSGLNAMRKEVERREKEMKDVGNIRSLQHEQFRKQSEVKRLEDEIQRLSILRDKQIATAGDILWRKQSPTRLGV